jgi:hypothetical protein
MTIARIIEADRKPTQSGKARAGRWILEYEREQPLRPDPLTGWAGSNDTQNQIRIPFDSKEEAIAYAEREGVEFHVISAPPQTLKIQAYADNFR